jgi:hypothetical protein
MKIKLFACLVGLIFILNCKDDDTTGDFIGTWVASNIEITDCENFTNNDFISVQCNDNSCYRLILTDSSTYSFQTGLELENGTWAASGNTLTFCTDEEGEQNCREASGVLNSSGMRLSFVEGNEGCITGYIMQREIPDDGN